MKNISVVGNADGFGRMTNARRGELAREGKPDNVLYVKGAVASGAELKRVQRIFRRLRGARGVSNEELWQHALYFSKTPEERCRISLQSARLALSLRRSKKKRSPVS